MPRKESRQTIRHKPNCSTLPPGCTRVPCVPALREAVKAWQAGGYKGVTDTTRLLLNHWFYTDHKLPTAAFSSITPRSKKRSRH